MLDFESDATPQNIDLSALTAKATEARQLEIDIKEAEEALKVLADRYRQLIEAEIPDFMDQLGVKSYDLVDGTKISVKEDIKASITKATKEAAMNWLRSVNAGSLIKTEVAVQFGKGEENTASEVANLIRTSYGRDVSKDDTVHPQTLSAWARERLAAGLDVDESITVFRVRKATLKGAKNG